MKYWISTDTHLGHERLLEYQIRPEGMEDVILGNIFKSVKKDDVLIHIGDICIGNDLQWNERLRKAVLGKMWLVKGNHDQKSDSWYLDHGWDFVCDSFTMERFGHTILFSHTPQVSDQYTLNIHGHFHNSAHRHSECKDEMNNDQILVALENINYEPVLLRTIVHKWAPKITGKENNVRTMLR